MAGAELDARPVFDRPVFSLGPLIHNPQALSSLKERGLVILAEEAAADQPDSYAAQDPAHRLAGELSGGSPYEKPVVIIRAHGVSPGVEEILRARGFRVVDATCPRVKASQNTALALARRGLTVFIAGEKEHAEVKGIAGYVLSGTRAADGTETPAGAAASLPNRAASLPDEATSLPNGAGGLPNGAGGLPNEAGGLPNEAGGPPAAACLIVGNAAEAEKAAAGLRRARPDAKTALIAQTTLSEDEYGRITAAVKKSFPDIEVKNTICGATRERQDALKKLCANVDAVIVAGGRESANTRRLLAIAEQCEKPCWLAETAADLPPELNRYGVAGLCAGASTPDSVIEEIEAALRGRFGNYSSKIGLTEARSNSS
jgi:4-hydroxy-3-methylbut-2-enyl diphosphate reductase